MPRIALLTLTDPEATLLKKERHEVAEPRHKNAPMHHETQVNCIPPLVLPGSSLLPSGKAPEVFTAKARKAFRRHTHHNGQHGTQSRCLAAGLVTKVARRKGIQSIPLKATENAATTVMK